MENPWYSFYIGDYARKTAHLSLLEHGAYRRLLDHYYALRAPLPADPTRLYRICGARSPAERKAVLLVASEFFIKTESLLRHERCDSEIEKLLKYSERQSATAKRRHSHGTATAMPRARAPQPQPQYKDKESLYSAEFESFWNVYPLKKDKGHAAKAYNAATKKGISHDELILGAGAYARHIDATITPTRFIAHASTWINGERWRDDLAVKLDTRDKPSNTDRAIAALHRAGVENGDGFAVQPDGFRGTSSGFPGDAGGAGGGIVTSGAVIAARQFGSDKGLLIEGNPPFPSD